MQLSVRQIVIAGVFGALVIVLGSIQVLGFPPIPIPPGNATTLHIPVSIGSVLGGPVVGAILGLIYGLFSFLQAVDPMFKDPLVSIVPRIFVGITPFLVYTALQGGNKAVAAGFGGAAGALTNSILVIAMLIIRGYLPAAIIPGLIPVILIEMVAAAVLAAAVVSAWTATQSGRARSTV
ncbi:MAG: ECF transporter S component [Chloroflexi bacterium]|nr:MAG: ECF transporter S component [Chloroflexota bacterium]